MKLLTSCIVVLLLSIHANAQMKLKKYEFGEGIQLEEEGGHNMRISGFLQPSLEMKTGSNSDETFSRFRMRRLRLSLDGSPSNKKFSYRFQVDLSGSPEGDAIEASNNLLLDAFVRYDVWENVSITVGQKGVPSDNLELRMSSQTLQFPERSRLTSAFGALRDFGIFSDASFKIRGTSMYIRPSIAITTGDGMNQLSKNLAGYRYAGRLDILPFGLFRNSGQFRQVDMMRELTPKLLIGFGYSYNDGISDRRGRAVGDIRYLDTEGNNVYPDYINYGANLLFKYRGFSFIGEYMNADAQVDPAIAVRVRNDGSTTDNFNIDGEQHVENYVKNRIIVGEGFNLQTGYLLKSLWSIDARFTHFIPPKYSFLRNGAFYDRPNYYELGVSKFLSRRYAAKVQASVTYAEAKNDARDNLDRHINGHEWIGRLMFSVGF